MSEENLEIYLRGIEAFNRRDLEFLPDYEIEVVELHDLGELSLCRGRGRAHGAASAVPLLDSFWQTIRWRDGKVIWWRNCPTEAEALEAIGFSGRG